MATVNWQLVGLGIVFFSEFQGWRRLNMETEELLETHGKLEEGDRSSF